MRISDWSSDVCSSDLPGRVAKYRETSTGPRQDGHITAPIVGHERPAARRRHSGYRRFMQIQHAAAHFASLEQVADQISMPTQGKRLSIAPEPSAWKRSEEHTSELQSLMRISYAVFCLKIK